MVQSVKCSCKHEDLSQAHGMYFEKKTPGRVDKLVIPALGRQRHEDPRDGHTAQPVWLNQQAPGSMRDPSQIRWMAIKKDFGLWPPYTHRHAHIHTHACTHKQLTG